LTFSWSQELEQGSANAEENYPYSEGINIHDDFLYFTIKVQKLLFILNLDTGAYKSTSTVSGLFEGQPDQVARIVNNAKSDSTLYFCEDGASMNGVHGRDKTEQFFYRLRKH